MEQVVAFGPPPLPPKTRRSPPDTTTVLASQPDVFAHQETSIASTASSPGSHVVKIRINPEAGSLPTTCGISASLRSFALDEPSSPCIRINLHSENEMIQNVGIADSSSPAYFYYSPFNCGAIMSSGQVSPSDTLDSGTCSDLDSTPPPLPTKKNKSISTSGCASGVSVTVIGAQHKRASSLTSSGADADSDDNESNISCDSLNSGDLPSEDKPQLQELDECKASAFLPQGLLQDIRERSVKLSRHDPADDETHQDNEVTQHIITEEEEDVEDVEGADDAFLVQPLKVIVEECTYEERRRQQVPNNRLKYESDKFINFHLNEMIHDKAPEPKKESTEHEDESFAGYKDLLQCDGSSTIRSAKGTIRGVKNRVRAGIATFLSINDQTKTYKEKDAGKVVVYTTTMGIVRETYQSCMKVKQILRTQLVRFEERDVFMSADYQAEIRDRMRCGDILVPQVFVDGQHIGDAETVEKLNETGELRRILKPYKTMDACTTCKVCGGYNLLPCQVCNGSKKSVHRNHFTAEFVALKCMNCDEVGLVKCTSCAL
ncbi:LOW QUALITY PROTEIN: glutaredoxin domain-containing cysteine-rich protein CG31559-like [Atheta coriaria]|uniref:LOW QUALITY PROTEIN: glutaredoxin domain-containing cysteine-rich protein CG31559-like n=1 Tax=Dalotia coriaria TaxID=877792 RepID=UPI0031F365D5